MVAAVKVAPPSYKPPERHSMYTTVLDSVVTDLRMIEDPIRQVILSRGGTMLSDGWDSIDRNHLINLLSGNVGGIFFDGTVKLGSEDHEDATAVSSLLVGFAIRIGQLCIIQLCTDTCSVMQAAWALVIVRLPWVTPTCCGTHVLALELKDLAKLPGVAKVPPPPGPPT